MAAKSTAAEALREYRSKILSDDVESRVAELATVVGDYEAMSAERERMLGQVVAKASWPDAAALDATIEQLRGLAQRQWAAEDAVYAAFEAAKKAGAKPSVLQQIGLRPEAALSAARGRAGGENRPDAPAGSRSTDAAPAGPSSAADADAASSEDEAAMSA
ncbi:hypothetical protein LH935_28245 (plasmid) [Gordonia polyisoprenivorans]|uniref:hypothetical protein n=1 Tax=Gordonia polyisoprenivorans TaxID=84595 RepID=UPI002233F8CD|nr:hypothetical protein LH935_28245 [Gordonia polyisoprenivorans]